MIDPGARFEIIGKLGEGGMGVVYEAVDRELGAHVALKALPKLSANAILRFKNEFRALADIQHPNLVGLGELIEREGRWFFTMDLVEGTDFLRWVRGARARVTLPPTLMHGRPQRAAPSEPTLAEDGGAVVAPPQDDGFDESKLRSGLAQLARGLTAVHEAGKVHRDIKPSNVLVTPRGAVKILDFGLIADVLGDAVWSEELVVGTPTFMAPEQVLGKRVGPEADWYSVGTLLYVALTGRPPFLGGGDAV